MNTLLIIHIALMVVSLVATVGSTTASLFSVTISKRFMQANIATTTLGIVSGAILLLQGPLGSRCAVLLAYLAMFVAAQTLIARRNQRASVSLDS